MTVCKPCEAHDLKHDRGKKSVTTYSIASVNITLLKYDVLRSVDLWIKGYVKSRAFLFSNFLTFILGVQLSITPERGK